MKLKLLTLLLAATALTAACSDDDDNTGPESQARVRVVHASPDAPNVDVLLDDAKVLSDVPYLASSAYLETSAGDHNLKVNAAGTATTAIDADVTLADGTDYTVIASDLVAQITPIVLQDDNTAPAAGNARVRAIHGAPSAPAVDIYVTAPGADLETATPVLTGVAFGDVADYLEVPAGEYQVRVTPAGTKTGCDRQRRADAGERPGAHRDRGGCGRWRRPVRPARAGRRELTTNDLERLDAQRIGSAALLVVLAATAADAQEAPPRFTLEGRGGFNVPTFDIADASGRRAQRRGGLGIPDLAQAVGVWETWTWASTPARTSGACRVPT